MNFCSLQNDRTVSRQAPTVKYRVLIASAEVNCTKLTGRQYLSSYVTQVSQLARRAARLAPPAKITTHSAMLCLYSILQPSFQVGIMKYTHKKYSKQFKVSNNKYNGQDDEYTHLDFINLYISQEHTKKPHELKRSIVANKRIKNLYGKFKFFQ